MLSDWIRGLLHKKGSVCGTVNLVKSPRFSQSQALARQSLPPFFDMDMLLNCLLYVYDQIVLLPSPTKEGSFYSEQQFRLGTCYRAEKK